MPREEEEQDMATVLEKEYQELKLRADKLRLRAEVLKVDEDGAIVLDRNNPDHRRWFEDEDGKE
jgi:hypothetical protein